MLTTRPRAGSIESLPANEQEQIGRLLDEWLTAAERGEPIEVEQLVAQCPEHADLIRDCVSGLQMFQAAAGAMSGPSDEAAAGGRPPAQQPAIGASIGEFRLVRQVGSGGMGVVYEAEQVSLGRRVALKVLHCTRDRGDTPRARFLNEAQAAAGVEHPNIVPVFAIGEEGGFPYYAMQLIDGQSLSHLIASQRCSGVDVSAPTQSLAKASTIGDQTRGDTRTLRPPEQAPEIGDPSAALDRVRQAATLGAQAADALAAAHRVGVVHRDVKPSNLLVDTGGKLWVTDFGLARRPQQRDLTQTGDILGTVRYMSPEQSRGEPVDGRTDIYSLGVTLFELATLRHPAGEAPDLEVLLRRGDFPTPRTIDRAVPRDFQTIVMKCLAVDPADRYPDATEVADDLRRFLAGEPIRARPPSVADRVGKWCARRRKTLSVAAALLLVALVGQSYTILLLARGQQQLMQGEREKSAALETAQENLHAAHAVVDRTATYIDRLATVPGADGVRQQLLVDYLGLYDELEQRSNGQPALGKERAAALGKMAALSEKLGRSDEALEQQLAAVDAWREAAARRPIDADTLRRLAASLSNAGLRLTEAGRAGEGQVLLEESIALLEAEPDTQSLVASARNNLGLARRAVGDFDAAESEFRLAIETWENLEDEFHNRDLAACYNNLASAVCRERPEDAAAAYQRAIELTTGLVRAEPTNRLHQADLARTYNNFGYLLLTSDDPLGAKGCYANAVKLLEHLVAASPLAAAYRRDLAVGLNNLGRVATDLGDHETAEKAFDRAVVMQEKLVGAAPENAAMQSRLASLYNNRGQLFDLLGRDAEADADFSEAVRLQSHAAELAPTDRSIRSLVRNHFQNYENHLRRTQGDAAAERIADEAAALISALDRHSATKGVF